MGPPATPGPAVQEDLGYIGRSSKSHGRAMRSSHILHGGSAQLHLAQPSLAAVYNHLQKFKVCPMP